MAHTCTPLVFGLDGRSGRLPHVRWERSLRSDGIADPMNGSPSRAAARHNRACAGFGEVVRRVGEGWERPSPCSDWDTRGVLEHVIGFHDVLLLRPLGAKPDRPKNDPLARWVVTAEAITEVLGEQEDHAVEVHGGSTLNLNRLIPMLTTDVLVHTWDLARATDVFATLDPELCQDSLAAVQHAAGLAASGMYAAPIDVSSDASVEDRLVAYLGRDPTWRPS